MSKRKCDVTTCTAMVPAGRFMCSHHWHLVPTHLQRTINARYRAADNVRTLLADTAYLEACAQAIEGFQKSLDACNAAANSYRRLLALQKEKQHV